MKIAIFISGPIRYSGLVHQRLSQLLSDLNPEFFFHLWKSDLGNKIRNGYESDWQQIPQLPKSKVCLFHDPYSQDFFKEPIGIHVNTHSSVNSVIGMFLGLSQLCAVFKTIPDFDAFTHILRVRTDCAFTCDNLSELLLKDPEAVVMAHDAGIPAEGWVSDHVMCAPVPLFLRIYEMAGIGDIYEAFERGMRNPEKMLKHLLDTRLPGRTRIVETIHRYRHYQLIYSPPRPTDAPWVRELIDAGRMPELFLEPEKHRVVDQDEFTVADQAANWAPASDPFKSRLKNILRRLKHRFLK